MDLNFQLTVNQNTDLLPPYTDKVILPPHVLSNIIEYVSEEKLPHPLIFKISTQDHVRFIGVREFSSEDNEVILPKSLFDNLHKPGEVNIQLVESIPKATSLTLRPKYFYSDVLNWKYFLENKLNKYYTVIKQGELLVIEDNLLRYELYIEDVNNGFKGWVNIVDTDIVLDVVASNDKDAKAQLEQQQKQMEELELSTSIDLDVGSFLDVKFKPKLFKIDLTKFQRLIIKLSANQYNIDMIIGFDKLLNMENFRYSTMDQDESIQNKDQEFKFIEIDLKSDEILNKLSSQHDTDDSRFIYLIAFSWEQLERIKITLTDKPPQPLPIEANTVQCQNCSTFIPSDKLILHEAFCKRNNIKCEKCNKVFLKQIPSSHWHCPNDTFHTESELVKFKHNKFYHLNYSCCNLSFPDYFHLVEHKSTTCPDKLIICKFCHLIVKQELATYQDNFENVSHHEYNCGNKTTECFKCGKTLRQKDLTKHIKSHNLDKLQYNNKLAFRKCSNVNCINESNDSNNLKLCEFCFGPLYSSQLDPDNKKLRMRLERRYMLQLSKGCGNSWCNNNYCKSSNSNLVEGKNIKDLLSLINSELIDNSNFYFCVGEKMTFKKLLFEIIKSENEFNESLILQAISERNDENGVRAWLDENGIRND